MKAVRNSGDLDCTYHFYYDGDSIVETRNGSNEPLQQFVWGLQYVDELVEIFSNIDTGAEQFHYALQDANWNVLGVVDRYSGMLTERYEYTPYGERVVFRRAHWSQADLHAPTWKSQRVATGLGQQLTALWAACQRAAWVRMR